MANTTYHCICSELIAALPKALAQYSRREGDAAYICAVDQANLANVVCEGEAMVMKLEDGFEKRYAVKCSRCALTVGYQLDRSQYEDTQSASGARADVVYILPGGLQTTEELQSGGQMSVGEVAKTLTAA